MDIESFLQSKIIENPTKKLVSDLSKSNSFGFLGKLFSSNKLSKDAASLGLSILHLNWQHDNYSADLEKQAREDLKKSLHQHIWEEEEFYALLVYFFEEEKAKYVKYAWQSIPTNLYQTGYTRRSFRAPNNQKYILDNQIAFLKAISSPLESYDYSKGNYSFYDLDLYERIRFDYVIPNNSYEYQIWAAALDLENPRVKKMLTDIINNVDGAGKVTRSIIKALLNSKKPENWQLVEKLLLAAQRQEGLRQTILEALDETHEDALKYLIKVIIDNKLTRFSSVVRAVDTWTGLGFDAKKATTVNKVLELADKNFSSPDFIKDELASKNNVNIYMALWTLAVNDVEKTVPFLETLFDENNKEKKQLALLFANETNIANIQLPLFNKAVLEGNPEVLAFALPQLCGLLNANKTINGNVVSNFYPDLFENLLNLIDKVPRKKELYEGTPFEWIKGTFERDDIFRCLFYLLKEDDSRLDILLQHFEDFSIDLRKEVAKIVLKDYFVHKYSNKSELKLPKLTHLQRAFAVRVLNDKSDEIPYAAFFTLNFVSFDQEVQNAVFNLLDKKKQVIRKQAEELVLKQSDKAIDSFLSRLIAEGSENQRLGALDMLLILKINKKYAQKEVSNWLNKVKTISNLSESELQLIETIQPQEQEDELLNEKNGYSFYDPLFVTPFKLPEIDPEGVYAKLTVKNPYGLSKSVEAIKKDVLKLQDIFNQNLTYEYEVTHWNNTVETVLLGNTFQSKKYVSYEDAQKPEHFETYPLHELWEQWYHECGLLPSDLFVLTFAYSGFDKRVNNFLKKYVFYNEEIIPNSNNKNYYYSESLLIKILDVLKIKYPFDKKVDYILDLFVEIYSNLPNSIKNITVDSSYYLSNGTGGGWQSLYDFTKLYEYFDFKKITDSQIKKYWIIERWKQYNGRPENIGLNQPHLYLFCKAYQFGLIEKSELYQALLEEKTLREITQKRYINSHQNFINYSKEFPFITEMVQEIQDKFLKIELKRGELKTSVSHFVQSFQTIFGTKYLIALLNGLGNNTLYKGYLYSWYREGFSKQQMFSYLIKNCYPLESDTQILFDDLIKKSSISEELLIQTAIYAPQWQKFISTYLGWEGLDSAIWWMHAHSKSSGYREVNAEAESEVSKYSSIDIQDFKEGIVDKEWFLDSYKRLGEKRWKMLYNSAKYITDGNGHRRIKLYYETILNKLDYEQVYSKILDKRDQDYLRLYGLVSIEQQNPENDILRRYNYINQFKKESRQFGSMRQSSEATAVAVAIENLARNAGYQDPIRLAWAMEAHQVKEILEGQTSLVFDDIEVKLEISQNGKAEILVLKDGKTLKSVPSSLKKNDDIVALTNHRKVLREQWTRSKKSLEEAMIRGDIFSSSEIINLLQHPVVSKHLEKLLLVAENGEVGFALKDSFIKKDGVENHLESNDSYRIAHCFDIYKSNDWQYYQTLCFDQKLIQPFKQIFRELYVPSEDELKENTISRRYAGHQVHPRQTVALLKSRGWKIDYESGLQKGFHKLGIIAKIYALADWFSPADVESPTLETVEFHSLKDFKNVPLSEISPLIFSEVMRDVDLVVSLAHVGAVDPETSQSSIEMRKVLLTETMRLLRLKNVTSHENHAIIEGTLGKYSVHLGSAVVHQIPGKHLNIIPVHSQHRGRIFLPFMDDDPKTAEMLAKVILLAKDKEIQDPTILSQITNF